MQGTNRAQVDDDFRNTSITFAYHTTDGKNRQTKMSTTTEHEPTVHAGMPMPSGYTFVRKGNVYITRNCRKLTSEAGRTVFLVKDGKGKQQGIRVTQHIYNQVRQQNIATASERAEAVLKKYLTLETKVRDELCKLFRKVPVEEIGSILKHTLKKRSGRVGRNKDMPMADMVNLAVRAHIRHIHTDYDAMLRRGVDREKAREAIREAVERQVKAWCGTTRGSSGRYHRAKQPKARTAMQLKNTNKYAARITSTGNARRSQEVASVSETQPRRRSLRVDELQEREASEELDMMDLD